MSQITKYLVGAAAAMVLTAGRYRARNILEGRRSAAAVKVGTLISILTSPRCRVLYHASAGSDESLRREITDRT